MSVSVAASSEPLLRLAAHLLVAAETDPRHAKSLRSTAATLQLLTIELDPKGIGLPAPVAFGWHGREGERHE